MENEELISVKKVSKVYRLYDRAIDRLLESISIRKKSYHKDRQAEAWKRRERFAHSLSLAQALIRTIPVLKTFT